MLSYPDILRASTYTTDLKSDSLTTHDISLWGNTLKVIVDKYMPSDRMLVVPSSEALYERFMRVMQGGDMQGGDMQEYLDWLAKNTVIIRLKEEESPK